MRDFAWKMIVAAALPGVLPGVLTAESTGHVNVRDIAHLISQLGSKKFQERERATRELDLAGGVALEALRQAAHNQDPEISRRAESLAQRIQTRLETAKILEPKRVHLHYQDVPLDEAIADFSRKSGFTINLQPAASGRRITLDTGDCTFWEAFDQLCKKADLIEQAASTYTPPARDEMRVINGRAGAPAQVVIATTANFPAANVSHDGPFLVTSGKPQALPTFYAGAVRVRALPADEVARSGVPKGDTAVLLEVLPQPKIGWQNVLGVQIEKAVDEQGQTLSIAQETGSVTPEAAVRMGNRALLIEAENARLRQAFDSRRIALKFKSADKPSKTLRELRGVLTAQVQTPIQPLMTVTDVLKSAGKTVKGPDGQSITIADVSTDSEGNVKMRVTLEDFHPGSVAVNRRFGVRGNRVVVRNGVVIGGGIMRETGTPGESKLALIDAQGRGFGLEMNSSSMAVRGNVTLQELQMTFHPRPGHGQPVKFIYSDHRTLNIEVPFVLKDVALHTK